MNSDLTAYKAALAKGSGRAMILLREGEQPGFREALLEACVHDQTYDAQCEEPREPYLVRLIEATGDIETIFDTLMARADAWEDEDDGPEFLLSILTLLVAGHETLDRIRVRARLERVDDEDRLFAAKYLIRIDGYPAFRRALDWLERDMEEEGWRVDGWLEALRARDGEGADQRLAVERATDALLDRVLTEEATETETPRSAPLSFEALREALRTGEGPFLVSAPRTDTELAVLSVDLAAAETDKQAVPYLRLFVRHAFAGDPAVLMRWRSSDVRQVRHLAGRAMERMPHPTIRALAEEWLAALNPDGVGLLRANYRPGDMARIEAVMDAPLSAFDFHGVGLDLLDVLQRHDVPVEESRAALLTLYERGPCSMCRTSVVRWFAEGGELPGWMAEECRFDVDPDTVAAVS